MDVEENREEVKGRVLVEMNGVCVHRGDSPALEAINWTISEGQHWGILGASGSGKSLLIDALTRRAPLSAGRISYFFDSTTPPTPFPPPGDISTFSSEDCRRFLAARLGYVQARWESSAQVQAPVARDLFDTGSDLRLLKTLRLDNVLERPVISLSSGEFRKFMLARAFLAAPRLLVLEDPFSGLDQESELEFRSFLDSLCGQPGPGLVILVSQPEHLLEGLTHLIIVEDYRIVQMGPRRTPPGSAGVSPAMGARVGRLLIPPAQSIAEAAQAGETPAAPVQARCRLSQPVGSPIIEMRDVGVRYGDSQILEGINWTVKERENWAILGPNGAGKSTLVSLVTADNPQAYANDIRLFGRRRGSGESIWDVKRQIGSVSPELQLCYPPELSALDVVCSGLFDSIGLYRNCSTEQEARATAWLERLGTPGVAGRMFWSLSAAEQRLVLLARALIKQPRLLVLDEPCLGLDTFHVARFLHQLENLCQSRPTTVLCVTHRLDELPSTISHMLKLERGRMGSVGPA